ncbi:unnamed protein product [Nezara viridula]|uniref:Uncharacterized protein n=1 Tax=Nezara viridula TaxID=85310 RepID=A0A9P0H968_NEZVI|nr:unnamed protein product [Nezara viridula]
MGHVVPGARPRGGEAGAAPRVLKVAAPPSRASIDHPLLANCLVPLSWEFSSKRTGAVEGTGSVNNGGSRCRGASCLTKLEGIVTSPRRRKPLPGGRKPNRGDKEPTARRLKTRSLAALMAKDKSRSVTTSLLNVYNKDW